MKWLVTTPAGVDLEALQQELEAAGATLESRDPIPLDGEEQVLRADGPEDLHERLSQTSLQVRVNPSSRLKLY